MNSKSSLKQNPGINIEPVDSSFKDLYKIAGAATLIIAVAIPIDAIAFIFSPNPSTPLDYYTLLQDNVILGLLSLDLLYLIDQVLIIPIVLALYFALRRTNESLMVLGLVFGIVSLIPLFASNMAFSMLNLSHQYALATTDAQRVLLLTAGETMLAISSGTAYNVHLILGSIAMIIISVVMLQSTIFSKPIAYLGIGANALSLAYYVPEIGLLLLLFSMVFFEIWSILLTRRFLQLGQGKL